MSANHPSAAGRPGPRAAFPVRRGLTLWLGVTLALWNIDAFLQWVAGARSLGGHLLVTLPALYFLCICIHDAVHGVLWPRRRVNQAMGWALSLVIALPFPLLQRTHLDHHRDLGGPRDAERGIYGVPLHRLPLQLPLIPWLYLRAFRWLTPRQQRQTILHLLTSTSVAVGLASLLGLEVVLLGWALPVLTAIGWFGLTTVYVPHAPGAERAMRWLTEHSGWHHDHHRDPRYPFSQYLQLRAFHLQHGVFAPRGPEQAVVAALVRPVKLPGPWWRSAAGAPSGDRALASSTPTSVRSQVLVADAALEPDHGGPS